MIYQAAEVPVLCGWAPEAFSESLLPGILVVMTRLRTSAKIFVFVFVVALISVGGLFFITGTFEPDAAPPLIRIVFWVVLFVSVWSVGTLVAAGLGGVLRTKRRGVLAGPSYYAYQFVRRGFLLACAGLVLLMVYRSGNLSGLGIVITAGIMIVLEVYLTRTQYRREFLEDYD